ncbi:hypothetical protein AGMMS50212_03280 [Spirochaetia bacterium]|nr:hypothetical protein AGMMS50212_03280 [Spirochaetia bacterium]
MNRNSIFRFRAVGIFGFFAAIAAFSVAVMFLWNALVPEIFDLGKIGYLQAMGITILCRILFGGLGFSGRLRGAAIAGGMGHHGNPFREKWMNMSPEKRNEFIEKMKGYHKFSGCRDAPFAEFFNDANNTDDNGEKNNI